MRTIDQQQILDWHKRATCLYLEDKCCCFSNGFQVSMFRMAAKVTLLASVGCGARACHFTEASLIFADELESYLIGISARTFSQGMDLEGACSYTGDLHPHPLLKITVASSSFSSYCWQEFALFLTTEMEITCVLCISPVMVVPSAAGIAQPVLLVGTTSFARGSTN